MIWSLRFRIPFAEIGTQPDTRERSGLQSSHFKELDGAAWPGVPQNLGE